MLRLLLPALAVCAAFICAAQKRDTLRLFYRPDQFQLSPQDKNKLDQFAQQQWDYLLISGYTDETEGEEYNQQLSRRRAYEVKQYLSRRQVPDKVMTLQFFGEAAPLADNNSEEGRAVNRQTSIVGVRYPRLQPRPIADPLKPITTTLDNGFIVTYRNGNLPSGMAENFAAGRSDNFQLVTNTAEMRQYNLYTNTTNDEILSSVLVVCGNRIDPCKLDSPVLVKVPIPFGVKCSVDKIKFFNAVAERGKMIWQEENKTIYPEVINGRKYIGVWIDNFCNCINFDFKIDPECFDVDSTRLWMVHRNIKYLTAEIVGLNTVYLPRLRKDSTHHILFLKDKMEGALVNFTLYNGRRWLKSFRLQPINSFPLDTATQRYVLRTSTMRFIHPRINNLVIRLKVNKDRYRIAPEDFVSTFVYLNRSNEVLKADLMLTTKKGDLIQYKDIPLNELPFDTARGGYVIDKAYLKMLATMNSMAKKK